jgi:hypothetical protein
MTMWYGGNGWGWCGAAASTPAMALLWVAVFTAIVLAVRSASRQPSDPLASTAADSIRAEGVATRHLRGDAHDNEFLRRLM